VARFFIHPSIQNFADVLVQSFGYEGQIGFLFPNSDIARRCLDFVRDRATSRSNASGGQPTSRGEEAFKVVVFDVRNAGREKSIDMDVAPEAVLAAAFVPETLFSIGKQFWQHSGEGISSRRAEFLHQAFQAGYLVTRNGEQRGDDRRQSMKGPKRYQKDPLTKGMTVQDIASAPNDGIDYARFVEERFGRNLDASLEQQAKLAVRKRIAGAMNDNIQSRDKRDASTQVQTEVATVSDDDVYLYPSGMSSIFNSHQLLMQVRGEKKSVMFGCVQSQISLLPANRVSFPYIDTLKILEKFGPGALFYGQGSALDLDDLESRCSRGEEFLALYCELPGNPLLKTPDVWRIRKLADQYGFAVVVDETIGNFLNVHVLPAADVIVSSLTKVFSGDSNVMGGR
jgi:cystathionine gamma-synthase